MLHSRLTWFLLLFISMILLIWRLLDFISEAVGEGFHMTRGGMMLIGFDAGVVELMIILAIIALIWKMLSSPVCLSLIRPSK